MSFNSTSNAQQTKDTLMRQHAYLNSTLFPMVNQRQKKCVEQLNELDKQILALGTQYLEIFNRRNSFQNVLENPQATAEQKRVSQVLIQQIQGLCETLAQQVEQTLTARKHLTELNEQYKAMIKLAQTSAYHRQVLNN